MSAECTPSDAFTPLHAPNFEFANNFQNNNKQVVILTHRIYLYLSSRCKIDYNSKSPRFLNRETDMIDIL